MKERRHLSIGPAAYKGLRMLAIDLGAYPGDTVAGLVHAAKIGLISRRTLMNCVAAADETSGQLLPDEAAGHLELAAAHAGPEEE